MEEKDGDDEGEKDESDDSSDKETLVLLRG